jgi:hypothetical protein
MGERRVKVIVTGGRNYSNRELVYKTLENLGVTHLIQGGATGADNLAIDWAIENEIKYHTEYAQWKDLSHPDARIKKNIYGDYDAEAGNRRNKKMLDDNPDAVVVAFKGGSGTAACVREAKKRKMHVLMMD